MIQNFQFHVQEKKELSPAVYFYTLDLTQPLAIDFSAGQFLQIKLNELLDSKNNPLWRPYSMFSSPASKNKIEFLVDVSPGGPGSLYFKDLKEGDQVLGRGPFGTFTVLPGNEELVFIATGSGIAPIRSMINDLKDKKDQREQSLYFGIRYPTDVGLFGEFEKIAKENPHFHFFGTVSRPDSVWKGLTGRVNEHLSKIEAFTGKQFYLCGAPNIVDSLKIFLVASGVSEEKIHYEQY